MGMFSEIARASAVEAICRHIAREMKARAHQPDAVSALKAVGRKALNEFEWDTPPSARKYVRLFRA